MNEKIKQQKLLQIIYLKYFSRQLHCYLQFIIPFTYTYTYNDYTVLIPLKLIIHISVGPPALQSNCLISPYRQWRYNAARRV